MKKWHIKRVNGMWEYSTNIAHSYFVVGYPVVRAAEWSDFRVLVANWRRNHGLSNKGGDKEPRT